MTKTLNRWLRKTHRWIAVPTALAIPVAFTIKLIGSQETVALWEKLDKIPSILMLAMAITGAYLFLLPYIVKGQRNKRNARDQVVDRQLYCRRSQSRISFSPQSNCVSCQGLA
jgi:hypothetical protein